MLLSTVYHTASSTIVTSRTDNVKRSQQPIFLLGLPAFLNLHILTNFGVKSVQGAKMNTVFCHMSRENVILVENPIPYPQTLLQSFEALCIFGTLSFV